MDNSIKISVIIPMYMCEAYAENLLDTLCNQHLKEIEVICVIDGSPDNTYDLVKRYGEKDPRVSAVLQKHGGAGKARNTGLSHASGKYVMFIDANDEIADSYLSEMYNAAEENRADIVMSDFFFQRADQDILSSKYAHGFDAGKIPVNTVVSPTDIKGLYQAIRGIVHTKMFRRQIIIDNDLRFSELDGYDDLFFTYTAIHCTNRLLCIDKAFYTYKQFRNDHSFSTVRAAHPERYIDAFISAYTDLYDWLKANNKANIYRETFCLKWKKEFSHLVQHKFDKEIAEKTANLYATKEPWCDMNGRELIKKSGLYMIFPEISIMVLKMNAKRFPEKDTETTQAKIAKLNNILQTNMEIRKILRDKYHKKIVEKDNFIKAVMISQFGITKIVRKMIPFTNTNHQ